MRKYLLIFLVTIWTIFIGISFVWLNDYSSRPGIPADVSAKLPKGIFFESDSKIPKLLIFVHPHCPCSHATLGELERLVATTQDLANIKIIFYKPNDKPSEWIETDLWQNARVIPNVEIATMSEEEIQRFGVVTSGQAILYDADGNLVFSGGITLSRAHEGNNKGRKIIEKYLHEGEILAGETPVFGCSLTSSVIMQNQP